MHDHLSDLRADVTHLSSEGTVPSPLPFREGFHRAGWCNEGPSQAAAAAGPAAAVEAATGAVAGAAAVIIGDPSRSVL